MSVLKVLKYGDKVLRKKSKPVSKISKKIHILIDNMLETLYAYNGVGLAAPQVGENLCIFVIDTAVEPKDRNPIIFINLNIFVIPPCKNKFLMLYYHKTEDKKRSKLCQSLILYLNL